MNDILSANLLSIFFNSSDVANLPSLTLILNILLPVSSTIIPSPAVNLPINLLISTSLIYFTLTILLISWSIQIGLFIDWYLRRIACSRYQWTIDNCLLVIAGLFVDITIMQDGYEVKMQYFKIKGKISRLYKLSKKKWNKYELFETSNLKTKSHGWKTRFHYPATHHDKNVYLHLYIYN